MNVPSAPWRVISIPNPAWRSRRQASRAPRPATRQLSARGARDASAHALHGHVSVRSNGLPFDRWHHSARRGPRDDFGCHVRRCAASAALRRSDPADVRSTDDRRLSTDRHRDHRPIFRLPASSAPGDWIEFEVCTRHQALSALIAQEGGDSCAPSDALGAAPDVPLAPLSTLGVGGAARWFIRADDAPRRGCRASLVRRAERPVVRARRRQQCRHRRQLATTGSCCRSRLTGHFDDERGRGLARDGWSRRELGRARRDDGRSRTGRRRVLVRHSSTVGGTPIQNVGAYGQEVCRPRSSSVTVYDCVGSRVRALSASECRFAYRMSRFKAEDAGRFVVCAVTFRLRPGPPTATYADVAAYLKRRRMCRTRRFRRRSRRGAAHPTIEGHGRRRRRSRFAQRRARSS